MQVTDKAALITGGGTGVGRATALELARRGCRVAVNYSKSAAEAGQTVAELRSLGVSAIALQGSVAHDTDCRRLVAQTVQELGQLDILVNSAGTTQFIANDDLEAVPDDVWERIFAVNLKGPFQMARAAKSAILAAGGGDIVNVSSVAAFAGHGSSIPYCASKGALNTLTVSLARVLAPKIRVNAVAPGFIAGRWLQNGLGEKYESTKAAYESQVPLGRVCEPEDIASVIVGLITGSDLVTGQVVVCDAGMSLGAGRASVGAR
jgi:3-oxoacyl-[acyl-carrier protein] reductase